MILLTRFIRSRSRDLRRDCTPPKIKRDAFLPHRASPDARLETSTFCIDSLDAPAVWRLGAMHVKTAAGIAPQERADLFVSEVVAAGLECDPDNEPERHVCIVGWSDSREWQIAAAQALAAAAEYRDIER